MNQIPSATGMFEVRFGPTKNSMVSSRRLSGSLSAADRRRLDQYLSSVRELEERVHSAEEGEDRPKPKVNTPPPPIRVITSSGHGVS